MTFNNFPNPFVAAGKVEDPRFFVGRKEEIKSIVSRMDGAQPTSINVVGEKRIGKSSLLYNFFLTWESRVQDKSRYAVIFLSLQSDVCRQEKDFYQEIAGELLKRSTIRAKLSICNLLQRNSIDRSQFSEIAKKCKEEGILPVLCLDDFEELFERTGEFNNDFYDNLRSLMDNNCLMLVLATKKPLDFYSKKHRLTSSFFNLGHILKLEELKDDETKDLVRLPATTVNAATPALGIHEQQLVRQLAGNHPFLLQIAGRLCCEAGQLGKDDKWIKKEFLKESKRLPGNKSNLFHLINWILRIFSAIGNFAFFLVELWNEFKAFLLGIVVLIILGLIVLGVFNQEKAYEFLKQLVGNFK